VLPAAVAGVGLHVDTTAYVFYIVAVADLQIKQKQDETKLNSKQW